MQGCNYFWSFLESHWSTRVAHTKKWTTPSGRQRAPKAIAQNIYFPDLFCKLCSSGYIWWPLPACPSFEKSLKKHCFYNVSDALAGPNMGHHKEHQKLQNERHAAWERSGEKKNERHAAWERFRSFDGPDGSPKKGHPKTAQTVYFKLFWAFFGPHVKCTGAKRTRVKTNATQHASVFFRFM